MRIIREFLNFDIDTAMNEYIIFLWHLLFAPASGDNGTDAVLSDDALLQIMSNVMVAGMGGRLFNLHIHT